MSEHLQADLIPLYLYGELSERDAQGVRDHMGECSECAAELADFERIRGVLEEERVPMRLNPEVRAQIVKRAAREIRGRRMSRWLGPFTPVTMLAAAATAVFVAILATVVVRRESMAPTTQVAQVSQEKDSKAGVPPPTTPSSQPPMPVAAPTLQGGGRMEAASPEAPKKSESSATKERDRTESELAKPKADSPTSAAAAAAEEELVTQPRIPTGAKPDTRAVGDDASKIELKKGVLGDAPLVEKQAPSVGFAPAPERQDQAEPRPAEEGKQEQALWRETTNTEATQANGGEGRKVAGGVANQQVAAPSSAPPPAGAVDNNFDRILAEAREAATRGERKKAIEVYRKLLKQYPQRKSEILRTVTDKALASEIEKK